MTSQPIPSPVSPGYPYRPSSTAPDDTPAASLSPVRSLPRALGGGLIACILAVTVFTLALHGLGLRADDQIAAPDAPVFLIGLLVGFACVSPLLPFTRRLAGGRVPMLLVDTLLISLLAASTALICRSVTDQTGTPGTVWGDLGSSALALLAVASLVWAAAMLGFALIDPAAAPRRSTLASFGVLIIFVAVVAAAIGLGVVVESAPTRLAAALSTAGAALTALAFVTIRRRANASSDRSSTRTSTTATPGVPEHGAPTRRGRPRTAAPHRPDGLTAIPNGLFHSGEIEYARLQSLPPFGTDLLILTDLRIMKVRTDADGAVAQLSQATPWQVAAVRAEEFRGRATVTVELHVGSSMRLEEATPAEAQRFVDTVNEVATRSRA